MGTEKDISQGKGMVCSLSCPISHLGLYKSKVWACLLPINFHRTFSQRIDVTSACLSGSSMISADEDIAYTLFS